MASSDFWQRLSASAAFSADWDTGLAGNSAQRFNGTAKLWMALDILTVIGAATLATMYELHTGPVAGAKGFWHGTLFRGSSKWILLGLLCGFIFSLVITSKRLNLYVPTRLTSFLHEQRLSMQACFTSGLLLTGALFLVHADNIPRSIVLITLALVAAALSVRRWFYRVLLYRRFERGVGTRNVLIVGTGAEAHALRHHIESIRHLGYSFKGFVELPNCSSRFATPSSDIAGSYEDLFQTARKQFVDEIFFATPCERGIIQNAVEQARARGIGLRVIPDMYDGLAWNSPIEYVGQFPTIPLHWGQAPELALFFKRLFDTVFSSLALLLLSPVLIAVAIAIKLDSPGPIFYFSDRIGKKGVVFRCIKFRTMVRDADNRRSEVMHMNERDGVLFKVSNDPRITRLGRFLRKYSLDELPQFINVLKGDMSVVGPRPPIGAEVKQYNLHHLRRLDVTPGITGLWQVQGRQDPSFASYISLDVYYIENWSLLLDFKIIVRTIGVVFSGTGS
jgi:exopolysaccharide biosynthesis polyprenyl glycosylphosphotransferase